MIRWSATRAASVTVDPTITSTDPGVQETEKPPEAPIAAKAKRGPIWPVLIIIIGLLCTLGWGGFLAWAIFRMIGAWYGS
jgi:hypothetical protein